MKLGRSTFILLISLFAIAVFAKTATIKEYKPILQSCSNSQTAIRSFIKNKKVMLLIVNNATLKTTLLAQDSISCKAISIFDLKKQKDSFYAQVLFKATSAPYPRHNDGIRHFSQKLKGAVLSSDLCPTRKPLYKKFFRKTLKSFNTATRAVPIVFAITGDWLKHHSKSFEYLLKLQRLQKIKITWANHSYSHPYPKGYRRNSTEEFFLPYGKKFNKEIFGTEILLIKNNQLPSVFFRFPGLVSSRARVKRLQRYGLIPLGSNAWLAKKDQVTAGSLILIHGNGNERQGMVKYFELLSRKRKEIQKGKFKFINIYDAFISLKN